LVKSCGREARGLREHLSADDFIYEWQGKLETAPEVTVFIKTRRSLAERAIAAARLLHPYTVPCFLLLPIVDGNADYIAWARQQTATEQE
jgi:periplasmic divalent cation tolerance protein